jgi:hypothetical protein
MCDFDLDDKFVTDAVIGYKVVLEENGKFYSPFTGIQYKAGKPVEIPIRPRKIAKYKELKFANVLDKDYGIYNKDYEGLTAVFKNDINALCYSRKFKKYPLGKFVIVKIELSGDLYFGEYLGYTVFLGNKINSIEKHDVK